MTNLANTYTNPPAGWAGMLDLSYLPGGVYFVETSSNSSEGGGFHAVKKVVKQ